MERYWFNIVTREVETDGDPGRHGDRMGPYRTRDEAARALEAARTRTIDWESSRADGREPSPWAGPRLTPLGRSDRWILAHRRLVRAVLLTAAVVLLIAQVVSLVGGGRFLSFGAFIFLFAFWGTYGITRLERRARELGEEP